MFKPIRVGATIIFIASVVVVCICSFWLRNAILTIVFVIIELLAYAWYSISYIPYAHSLISKLSSKIIP
ncbi:hypothetical protein WALSEDRAFT_68145 [Wallemia mellicola CBS 633.66]|uniref:Protein transport protein SFT2 n=1 Tax=Wallemia mellicola (strain ATCC MYA-4683 / CBS 633.66) TaxID=671144 RepID=I4YFG9_WALMC|nr:hypothetical protein WALSEDRAFT_68145 [Wallemia mellicola CBS 633.66]EIM22711.1 hypothetical protein WALSEDRAFT_68145 [Wallemia mellicola CBS 633.66]|eukprot:XP_006957372.1 hypothetical protein WALSEDRAFT_68145 [Wallemia mellicola CBS 633.66]